MHLSVREKEALLRVKKKMSRCEAAAAFGVSTRTVSRVWSFGAVPRKVRRTPPSIVKRRNVAARLAQRIRREGERRIPAFPTAGSIASALGGVSPRTILRDVHAVGLRAYVRTRHPCKRNYAKRCRFCRTVLRQSASWFRRLTFSDEHFINVDENTSRTMFASSRANVEQREGSDRRNIPTFQIWAAMGVRYRSKIIFFPKIDGEEGGRTGWRLNSTRYIRRCLLPVTDELVARRAVWQQDGAKCHVSGKVWRYLARKGIETVNATAPWPAGSPDMNMIESMWSILDRRIAKLCPSDEASLREAAIKAWKEIPQDIIDRTVLKFRSRVQEVLKRERGQC